LIAGRFLLLVACILGLAAPAVGQDKHDGNVVRLNGTDWRLHGVDFPDADQVCADGWRLGDAARAAVRQLTEGATVDCKITTKDQYSRPVASCLVNGQDLGATLIRRGLAWASLRYTWRYVIDDWMAWLNGEGLYGHRCDKPWEWRARSGGQR